MLKVALLFGAKSSTVKTELLEVFHFLKKLSNVSRVLCICIIVFQMQCIYSENQLITHVLCDSTFVTWVTSYCHYMCLPCIVSELLFLLVTLQNKLLLNLPFLFYPRCSKTSSNFSCLELSSLLIVVISSNDCYQFLLHLINITSPIQAYSTVWCEGMPQWFL